MKNSGWGCGNFNCIGCKSCLADSWKLYWSLFKDQQLLLLTKQISQEHFCHNVKKINKYDKPKKKEGYYNEK